MIEYVHIVYTALDSCVPNTTAKVELFPKLSCNLPFQQPRSWCGNETTTPLTLAFCFCWSFRCYKRYFYCHLTTGETQWDYPDAAASDLTSPTVSVDHDTDLPPGAIDRETCVTPDGEELQEGRVGADRVSI